MTSSLISGLLESFDFALVAPVSPFVLDLHSPVLEEKPDPDVFLDLHSASCPWCVRLAGCMRDSNAFELVAPQVKIPSLEVQISGNLQLFVPVLIVELLLQSLECLVWKG